MRGKVWGVVDLIFAVYCVYKLIVVMNYYYANISLPILTYLS